MHLRSVEILGFKSFADKTRLEFSDGITALIGPNGCGKSNIVDAIKWVLGEQSARSMRAERMEDVIFNGTESRKAVSVAEITLTMSNDESLLPLDASEVAVRRRLYRSGESEYFVNNVPVRLREVRELFFDTGVGKSAYSILEQGRIDQILSNKPEERRMVFEEAAGITRYRARGQEAERKLEKTHENMRQVDSILGEVKRSYESLRQQAEKTEKYRELKDRSFDAELEIQLLRLRGFMERRDELEQQLQRRSQRRSELKAKIDGIRQGIEQSIDQVNTMESRLIENQKQLYRLDLDRHSRDSQKKMLGERAAEIERKVKADQERARLMGRKLAQGQEEHSKRRAELDQLQSMLGDVEKNISDFETDISRLESRIKENEGSVQRLRGEAAGLETRAEELRLQLRSLTDDIVSELDQRLREVGYSAQERQQTEQRIRGLLEALKIQVSGKAKLLDDHLRVGQQPAADRDELLESIRQLLRDALGKIEQLFGSFQEYQRCTPAFLEDFLAPAGIMTRKREIDQQITDTAAGIASRRAEADRLGQENQGLAGKIGEYRRTLEGLRVNRAQLHTRRSGLEAEIQRLRQEVAEQELEIAANNREIEEASGRRQQIEAQMESIDADRKRLDEEHAKTREELARLEREINSRNEGLVHTEKSLKEMLERQDQLHNDVERLQMGLTELKTEIRALYANFSEQYGGDLAEHEGRMFQIHTPLKELRSRQAQLREELRKLGQVNLMAPEEFNEVSERFKFLSGQLQDLRKATEDLQQITREIRTESAELFLETYNTIKKSFHLMFRRLFGGGRAELKLLEPEKVLESGIEIYAQPPGKKLENISLLSGGEKTLTAIALLFAFFMVRPSPFCILDEIDAALDDQNIGRFVHVLKEFAGSSQFIVVTHNKKTIAAADTLLGVTMEESGVSKIVAIRLENRVEEKSYA